MLKILHTSDLHIGKRLYQASLYEEQSMFFQWLVDTIRQQNVNVLLISGDIFDVANPSNETRRVYYELLRELMILKCKVIIAGGNHDSPAVLEAPKTLLRHLDIHLIGNLPSDPAEMLVPVTNAQGYIELVIACIPYLRDADLRQYNQDESWEDRIEAIRNGITAVYQKAADLCHEHYPGVTAMAMGHLFVQGSDLTESEREIQIGNLAGLESGQLPGYFSYYALGHLHKPQDPAKKIIYSGSPVKLSFSESFNKNRVVMITLDNEQIDQKSIIIPQFRRLFKIEGTVESIKEKLNSYQTNGSPLKDFIEIIAMEDNHDPSKIIDLETLIGEFEHEHAIILKYRIRFKNGPLGTATIYEENQNIAEMKPIEVFLKRMEKEELEENTQQILLDAFRQILDEVEQKSEE